jgi:hypothetical protein
VTSNYTPETEETRLQKLYGFLRECEGNFRRHLQILLDGLNYGATELVALIGLCVELRTFIKGTGYMVTRTDRKVEESWLECAIVDRKLKKVSWH